MFIRDKDEIVNITLNDNGTSVFLSEGDKQKISLKSASSFINSEDIDTIDLLKINIEGGEFSVLPNLIENNKQAKIVFDCPFIVKNNDIYAEKAKDKFLKTYWPYIHPTSCISIKKDCFNEVINLISYEDYTDVWIDLRICLFSKYILKDFHIINENLTFYRKTDSNISSKFDRFSKNWWKRRMQAHQFFQKFSKDNELNFNKNFDFLITKLICKFL